MYEHPKEQRLTFSFLMGAGECGRRERDYRLVGKWRRTWQETRKVGHVMDKGLNFVLKR
jgi:hypothetical protein